MQLWQQILIGMIVGIGAGAILGEHAIHVKPIGTIFINLIKMIIVPLILFSLISAMISMDDIKRAGRIGMKSFGLYLGTTAFAITLGLVISSFMEIGTGVNLNLGDAEVVRQAAQNEFSISETIIGLFPTNPIQSMATGNILQIIVFSIFAGLAINLSGAAGEPVAKFVESANEVTHKLTLIIMKLAPFGVAALMAWLVGTQDGKLLESLFKVMLVVYLVCAIQIFFVYGGMLSIFTGLNPLNFFRKIVPAQIMAYSTSSSSATLPLTMQVAQEKLGVSRTTSSFTLPLGTTVNMDGTALYQGVCALFIAQAMGVSLEMSDYVTIILTATLASIGSAGIPGAGLIMLTLVLESIGLPVEGVAIIAGIDRVLDMARTTVNVSGDATIAVIVDNSEDHFNKHVYESHDIDKSESVIAKPIHQEKT